MDKKKYIDPKFDHLKNLNSIIKKAELTESLYKKELYGKEGKFFDFHQDVGCMYFGKSDCGYWMQ